MMTSWHARRRPARRLAAVLLAILVSVSACADGRPTATPAPIPDDLHIALAASGVEVGAVQFTLSGTDIGEITAIRPEHMIFTRRTSATSVSVAVVGESLAGPLVRFGVPDVRAADGYEVALVEAADRENRVVSSLSALSLQIARITP